MPPLSRVALVTVDGGASRCRLAAFDAHGVRLAELAIDAPASLSVGERGAWDSIRLGLGRLAESLGAESPDAGTPEAGTPEAGMRDIGVASPWWPPTLALGLAGSLRQSRRQRFLSLVEAATAGATRCLLVTDGHAQLLGAGGGAPGVCLAVGTGSVLHWLDERGEAGMAGGWGFPAGDEGSGAWLGLRLLGAYLRARDAAHGVGSGAGNAAENGATARSTAFDALERRIGTSVSAVQAWSTNTRPSEVASLAPLVVAAAGEGDPFATALLEDGAAECAALIALAPPALPLYLVGGLAAVYRSRLPTSLRARLAEPRGDALDGLWTLVADERGVKAS